MCCSWDRQLAAQAQHTVVLELLRCSCLPCGWPPAATGSGALPAASGSWSTTVCSIMRSQVAAKKPASLQPDMACTALAPRSGAPGTCRTRAPCRPWRNAASRRPRHACAPGASLLARSSCRSRCRARRPPGCAAGLRCIEAAADLGELGEEVVPEPDADTTPQTFAALLADQNPFSHAAGSVVVWIVFQLHLHVHRLVAPWHAAWRSTVDLAPLDLVLAVHTILDGLVDEERDRDGTRIAPR